MVHRNVIMILELSVEASCYVVGVAGGSCPSSQGRDTITIGIINNTSVWGISLPENYSKMEEVQERGIIVVKELPGLLLEEMIKRIK